MQEEWDWFKERTSVIMCEDSQGVVAYDSKGRIMAACVADSFTVDACSVHLAIDRPIVLKSGFLEAIADHLFNTCGRARIFGLLPSNNQRAIKFDEHIGFTRVATIPNAIREGVDYIVMVMERGQCPWLPENKRAA